MYYIDYKEVGQRIAARRRELGLKQWQVNELAGIFVYTSERRRKMYSELEQSLKENSEMHLHKKICSH